MSFEVRGPGYGMFIMGRAATVAKKPPTPETTLVFDSRIANKFTVCEESAELIIERPKSDKLGINRKNKLQMSVDGGPIQTVPVEMTAEKGDTLIYIDLPKDYIQALLAGHKSLSVQNAGSKVAEFSLLGMKEAWRDAKESCAAFACPIGATCQ